jgi:predicted membrane protein
MVDDPKFQDAVQRAVTTARDAAERAVTAGHDAAHRVIRNGPYGPRHFHRIAQLVLGLLIVTAGILFTLDNLHILRARDYLRMWPIALVVIGVAQILEWRTPTRFIAGGIWIFIGVAMLARRLGFTDMNVWDYWPLVFVVIGSRFVWHAYARGVEVNTSTAQREPVKAGWEWRTIVSDDAVVSGMAVMGGFGRRITSQAFQRAELTAFMGGGKIDLREAKLAGDQAIIDVFTIMGGFEILVPDTWTVIVDATPFMGGIDDKTRQRIGESAPRLIVRGFIMMGGVEIKN